MWKFLGIKKEKKISKNKLDQEEMIKNNNLLKQKNDENVDYFTFEGMTFYAKPCNIYDGDTFSIIFMFKGEAIKYRCRCYGYDTPEMRPSLKDPNRENEKKLALEAKNRFIELLNKNDTKLVKVECLNFDKYGRLLVKVYNNIDELSINEIMVNEGHGVWYEGGTKNKVWK